MNSGYVYAHKSPIDGRVFYVGLSFSNADGKYQRANDLTPRNVHHERKIRKHGCHVEILIDHLDEFQCKVQEILAIRYFDTFNCGCNYTKGGDGVHGFIPSAEQNARNSEAQIQVWKNKTKHDRLVENRKRSKSMKNSEAVKLNIRNLGYLNKGTGNAMYGKNVKDFMDDHNYSTMIKKRVKANSKKIQCIETGEIFESAKIAATRLGISPSCFYRYFAGKGRSKRVAGYTWRRL